MLGLLRVLQLYVDSLSARAGLDQNQNLRGRGLTDEPLRGYGGIPVYLEDGGFIDLAMTPFKIHPYL